MIHGPAELSGCTIYRDPHVSPSIFWMVQTRQSACMVERTHYEGDISRSRRAACPNSWRPLTFTDSSPSNASERTLRGRTSLGASHSQTPSCLGELYVLSKSSVYLPPLLTVGQVCTGRDLIPRFRCGRPWHGVRTFEPIFIETRVASLPLRSRRILLNAVATDMKLRSRAGMDQLAPDYLHHARLLNLFAGLKLKPTTSVLVFALSLKPSSFQDKHYDNSQL